VSGVDPELRRGLSCPSFGTGHKTIPRKKNPFQKLTIPEKKVKAGGVKERGSPPVTLDFKIEYLKVLSNEKKGE